jgi:hypothetical protein
VVNPTFVADVLGTYVVQLSVNDGTIDSLPDTVMVIVENTRPVADAGPDQDVPSLSSTCPNPVVMLDGRGSTDANGNPLPPSATFRWSFTSQPAGSQPTLSNPNIVQPTFIPCPFGTYVVQLIVSDGTVDSLPDEVSIRSHYIFASIDSKTRFATIIGTASLTVMMLGLFSRRRHGSSRQRIKR